MPCSFCNHPSFEHDNYGCKHTACECKANVEGKTIPVNESRFHDLEEPFDSWAGSSRVQLLVIVSVGFIVLGAVLVGWISAFAPWFLDVAGEFGMGLLAIPFLVAVFFLYMARKVRSGMNQRNQP